MRTFIHEETISDSDMVKVLDYEKATEMMKKAKTIAVGQCACRTVAKLAGSDIGKLPLRCCFTFNKRLPHYLFFVSQKIETEC